MEYKVGDTISILNGGDSKWLIIEIMTNVPIEFKNPKNQNFNNLNNLKSSKNGDYKCKEVLTDEVQIVPINKIIGKV